MARAGGNAACVQILTTEVVLGSPLYLVFALAYGAVVFTAARQLVRITLAKKCGADWISIMSVEHSLVLILAIARCFNMVTKLRLLELVVASRLLFLIPCRSSDNVLRIVQGYSIGNDNNCFSLSISGYIICVFLHHLCLGCHLP